MKSVRGASAVLVWVALVVGCAPVATPVDGPPTPEPGSASAGAELVCGMDRADLEAATGDVVDPWSNGLTVVDGVGAGECVGWIGEGLGAGDVLVRVVFDAASSQEAADRRAKMAGEVDGIVAPAAVYSGREGAIWGDVLNPDGSYTLGGNSYIFVGETMVTIQLTYGAVGRDRVADHLALTEQIAATYGLETADGP